jgi:DNA polymerase-1
VPIAKDLLRSYLMKRTFLIDGNSYLYRAFYATPYLANSKGVPTNATYAFLSMIRKLVNDEKPDALVVVFDSRGPSFREEICRAYKAQRPPMPPNLAAQIPHVKAVISAMGIPVLEKEGFEADDIIGTVVERLKADDGEICIVTSDKDMMQLVSDRVRIIDTAKNLRIGEEEVAAKLGVKPGQVIDYLALCGDSTDNIPGVPGVGEKTARELMAEFGSLDGVYGNLGAVKREAVRKRLEEGRELGLMSRQLATIRLDVPIETGTDALQMKGPDVKVLRTLYRELEFSTLYRELGTEDRAGKTWHEVSLSNLGRHRLAILAKLQGKNPAESGLEGFAAYDGEGVFFSRSEADFREVMASAEEVVTHNLKPTLSLLRNAGATTPSHFFDTMLAAYLVNPLRKEYGLGGLLGEFLDVPPPSGDLTQSLIEGTLYLMELGEALRQRMEEMGLSTLFGEMEMPLIEVLAGMECLGVRVDREALISLSRGYDQRLNTIAKEIHGLAGDTFNINSPQQLQRILFDELKLPVQRKTKTGRSTDTEVLEALSVFHPLPGKVLDYRTLAKLKNTYIDVLPTLVHPLTGRIHASFNQMVVATGRLSSSDPNLQNIPIRGEDGRRIREAFIPADGFLLLSSDYSQIELRVLAHISGDPVLVDTFLRNEDIHTRVAREVFGVTPDQVTQDMRRTAKVINFGIIYGMSPFGLSRELGISQKEAQRYIEDYFEKYKGVREYIDKVLEEAYRLGYVRTLFGRVRRIPELQNPDGNVRQFGERAAMNTPIQGTAADIIKLAMVRLAARIKEEGLSSRLIMQVHDELVFEVREEELSAMKDLVKAGMESAVTLSVPLQVSLGVGTNWALAHD